jgi:hypothetical protein
MVNSLTTGNFSLFSVVGDLPSTIRDNLHRTMFLDINSLTEEDMVGVLFGIYKDVHVTEHEFYEPKSEKKFWIHKMDEDNLHFNALVSVPNYTCLRVMCMSVDLHRVKLTLLCFVLTMIVHA